MFGRVVVAVEVSSQRLPANPLGHEQVERIVHVPPFRQPAVKHETNVLILYSHKLPLNKIKSNKYIGLI